MATRGAMQSPLLRAGGGLGEGAAALTWGKDGGQRILKGRQNASLLGRGGWR